MILDLRLVFSVLTLKFFYELLDKDKPYSPGVGSRLSGLNELSITLITRLN
jgi:hypothetical protein